MYSVRVNVPSMTESMQASVRRSLTRAATNRMLRLWTGIAAIATVTAGCQMAAVPVPVPMPGSGKTNVARIYSGPERLPHEIGIIAVVNSQIDVQVLYIDGIRIEGQRVFHLLPGETVIQIRCVR